MVKCIFTLIKKRTILDFSSDSSRLFKKEGAQLLDISNPHTSFLSIPFDHKYRELNESKRSAPKPDSH